jgi:hypothetical protein
MTSANKNTDNNVEQNISTIPVRPMRYPKPAPGVDVSTLHETISPMIEKARSRLGRLKKRVVYDNETGFPKEVRIPTANELQRILFEASAGHLVIDTVLATSDQYHTTLVATCYVLHPEGGYVPLKTRSASIKRAVGQASPLLTAESKAIKRVLREIGLRAEEESFDEDDTMKDSAVVKQAKKGDETIAKTPDFPSANEDPVSQKKTAVSEKAPAKSPNKQPRPSRAKTNKPAKSRIVAAENDKSIKNKPELKENVPTTFPDKGALNYTELLVDGLKKAKSRKGSRLKVSEFISQVLGTDAPSRFVSCSTTELEALYQHYIIDAESSL